MDMMGYTGTGERQMQRRHQRILRNGRRVLAVGGAFALAFTSSGAAFASTQNSIAAQEWALSVLNVSQIRSDYDAHGAGVTVAVIDSGVDPSQPDLHGRLVDGVNLTNPEDPTSDFSDASSESHGTSVATVIAGYPHEISSGNYYGMIGLADQAKIMPVKIGNDTSFGDASILAGIQYVVSHGAQVINLSFGGNFGNDPQIISAIGTALASGVVVVAAAGNNAETGDSINPIADIPGVLDVGGVDSNGQRSSYSHYGADVSVAAPDNAIEVGLIGGKYGEVSGTSQAAPWVSAEAALLIAAHPGWTSGQIVSAIVDYTMQSTSGASAKGKRYDDNVGYGVIDPLAALGASEPASTANPLGGPKIVSTPAENLKNAGASASASAPASASTSPLATTASGKSSSSNLPLIIGIVVGVLVLVGLLIFLLTRGRNNRSGGGGQGGGGGGGGYPDPQSPARGQYAQPPQSQQYPPQGQQVYPPQPQSPNPNPNPNPYQQPQNPSSYQQPQPQYPPVYPPQGGGYGQQNPYQGQG
jgi:subtilisin family serine protease